MSAEQEKVDELMQRIHAANRADRTCTNGASTYALGYLAQYAASNPGLFLLLGQAVVAAEEFVKNDMLARTQRLQARSAGAA